MSGTIESVQPSAPAWTDKNKVCFVSPNTERRDGRKEQAPVDCNSYLAYVGVITKMMGKEDLAAGFWGCLVVSDFFICS